MPADLVVLGCEETKRQTLGYWEVAVCFVRVAEGALGLALRPVWVGKCPVRGPSTFGTRTFKKKRANSSCLVFSPNRHAQLLRGT